MHFNRPARAFAALALASSLGLAACGDDDDSPALSGDPTTSTTEEETTTSAPGETVEVTGIDYAFEGIAPEVEVGTELTFTNGSDKEAHELILMRVNDGEERSVDELLALPEEEAMKAVTMKGVSVAPTPGGEGQVVDGELVADEPGRYVALCFIPVGADPAAMQEAMESEGPPPEDPNAGPPHFVQGMKTEFTVK